MCNLIISIENSFSTFRGKVFIIEDFKDKIFQLEDEIIINNKFYIIKGIELSKALLTDEIKGLALNVKEKNN